jgi:HK97 family phage major capsid protein
MTIAALRESRASKTAEMRALHDAAATANRDLTTDEATRFETLAGETRAIETNLGRAEKLADLERRAESTDNTMANEHRGYSLARAVRGSMDGKLDGIEGEAHAELSRGREVRGVMVPTHVLLGGEQRAGQFVTPNTAGGYTVGTQTAAVADRFRPSLKTEAMGATVLRNLTGFVDLPKLAASGTAYWIGEQQATTRSSATFAKVAMGPKTVSGEYEMSRRLMLQSNESIEALLRRDLGFILAQGLDLAAIRGTGATTQPEGLLGTTGLEKVATATLLCDTAADLIAALELDNVTGTTAFLTNPTVAAVARKLKDGNGQSIPMLKTFHDERVEITTQVPTDIGVSANKSALIYGMWSELVIGYWSAVDILLNPYHSDVASKGGALLHAFLDADVAVRHIEAFAYSEI